MLNILFIIVCGNKYTPPNVIGIKVNNNLLSTKIIKMNAEKANPSHPPRIMSKLKLKTLLK